MDNTKEKIRAYLLRFFRNAELRDDTDIFAAGFVNSLMAMQLVMFVEKEFQISVEDEDLDVDNFRSVDAIAALVQRQAALRA